MTIFVTGLALELPGRTLVPTTCLESPHFEHLSLLLCAWLGSDFLKGGL